MKYLIIGLFLFLSLGCDEHYFQDSEGVINELASFEISGCVNHDVDQVLPSGLNEYVFCNVENNWDIKIHLYDGNAETICKNHIRCLQSIKYYEEWEKDHPHLKDYVGIQVFKENVLIIFEPSLRSGGWETDRTRNEIHRILEKNLDL